ncbi:CDP-alcohol phosphatidyltransferase family protein [Desertihabitans brevis]|uniref:CDP-alcohol phosphatidyltransferase family protein n=2 Tax=Desertihabitans brevis TaxID=2268447 RepID=A0A367Z0D5_9ACTN|nr:CDP-alcohol phosphatidyltransferase family protein [Desertihabitans brevis]
MVPVFGWMLLAHPDETGWRVASTVVFVLAIATDSLDGYLARRHDLITSFGKLADPIADKALTGMAFVGLSIIGELWWWVTVVILLREWGITVLRFVVLRYGVMAASRGGKVKTVLQAVALVLYLLPLSGWPDVVSVVAMIAALVVTVVTGVDYVLAAVRLRRQGRTA